MRRCWLPFLICVGLVWAESPEERGRRVVDEAINALGGPKFLAVRDRIERGRAYSFYREQLSGLAQAAIYTRLQESPSGGSCVTEERQSFGKDEDSGVLFKGDEGWEISFRGARPLPEATLRRHREGGRLNVLYLLRCRMSEPGMQFLSLGSEVVDNQPTEKVEIADAKNESTVVYFHRSTKLPVKQEYFRRDPATKDRIGEVVRFAKYRTVDGVQWPFHILRERDGEKVFELFSESVALNPGLKDELFRLPSGLPVLKPSKG